MTLTVKHMPLPASLTGRDSTIVSAVNHILRVGLATFPRMLIFGEDIEDPKGGVFGFTKGLSRQFPKRVFNSPLAEATIVGTAVGLAATGFEPVFELQFVDFLSSGFNQLVQQVATLRWRSNGDWQCPMVCTLRMEHIYQVEAPGIAKATRDGGHIILAFA